MHRGSWLLVACALLPGCPGPRRGPNSMVAVAVEVAAATADVGGETATLPSGGVHVGIQVAETTRDWLSARGRLDLGIGGDQLGATGHALLDAQLGLAFLDGADHPFARLGVLALAEADSLTGLYLLETPTLFFGYQHHGTSLGDQWHVDVGPRVSFASVGSTLARGELDGGGTFDFVAAPTLGGAVILMGPIVAVELTYFHAFAGSDLDVVRGTACAAAIAALCLETRHVVGAIGGEPSLTAYYGVRFGLGLALGVDRLF